MKTHVVCSKDIRRDWHLVDAQGLVMGRAASQIAHILRGKHKPTFCTYLDVGDHVVVINVDKIKFTGNKMTQKFNYRHSSYPGGLTATPYSRLMVENPKRAFMLAVKRMLPRNTLGRKMLTKLRVYCGPEHEHQAQHPKPLTLEA